MNSVQEMDPLFETGSIRVFSYMVKRIRIWKDELTSPLLSWIDVPGFGSLVLKKLFCKNESPLLLPAQINGTYSLIKYSFYGIESYLPNIQYVTESKYLVNISWLVGQLGLYTQPIQLIQHQKFCPHLLSALLIFIILILNYQDLTVSNA